MSSNHKEPIAIIGIGCRFPGGVVDVASFWELLCSGRDPLGEVPADRWNADRFYSEDPDDLGTMRVREGGFLDRIDEFDASFFRMSPREAAAVDPRQRLLLEITWEALEDGGQVAARLAGSRTGVFIGAFADDYKLLSYSPSQRPLLNLHTMAGASTTLLSNRISHWFDFRGASVSMDTACSSSLVAAHYACHSIWDQSCQMALVGGVNVILWPEWTIATARGGYLSPDGRCKSFDHRANGYARSEAAAVIVLKPLGQAVADGDRIYAAIRATVANQDGATPGISVPSADAQIDLMTDACRFAEVDPSTIGYVEAHGTGTPVGDPTEARAIGTVYGRNRPRDRPLTIGSVKSNIGHTEAAAGVAGLIKAALCLHHGRIPPNIHLEKPNPEIPFDELRLRVPTEEEPFPEGPGPRRVGINSFGFGGSNAHALFEGHAPVQGSESPAARPAAAATAHVWPLSAHTEAALIEQAEQFAALAADETLPIEDVAYNLSVRRATLTHRLAVVARSAKEFAERLRGFAAGEAAEHVFTGRVDPESPQRLVFVYSGMGTQWWAMGRQLLTEEPVFAAAVRQCAELFAMHDDLALWDELAADEADSRINETRVAQPAIFAIQVALTELWRAWGVRPDAVVGHSVGEAAAAYVSDALSLDDAVRLVHHRSRLQHRTEGQGRMLAVNAPAAEVEPWLEGYRDKVALAAANSPDAITLAGDEDALEELRLKLEAEDISCRPLRVNVPFHSPAMDALGDEFVASLGGIEPRPARIPFYSTVTGGRLGGGELTPAYWFCNMREPVQFARTIDTIAGDGFRAFLEVGAHPVLTSYIADSVEERGSAQSTVLSSLVRKRPDRDVLLATAASLYTSGYPLDWAGMFPQRRPVVSLPTYPFQRTRHWSETEESRQNRCGRGGRRALLMDAVHPLLGSRLPSAEPVWDARIDLDELGFLADHRVGGAIVYPGAAYVEMVLAAVRESGAALPCVVEQVEFRKALEIAGDAAVDMQTFHDPEHDQVRIYARADQNDAWSMHARAQIGAASAVAPVVEAPAMASASATLGADEWYRQFRRLGLEYGPAFQGIAELRCADDEAFARLGPSEEWRDDDRYWLPPTLLDACFQVLLGAVVASAPAAAELRTYLPIHIARLRLHGRPGAAPWCHARVTRRDDRWVEGDILLADSSGRVLLEIEGLRCRALPSLGDVAGEAVLLHRHEWQRAAAAVSSDAPPPGSWLILGSRDGLGERLAARLRAAGQRAVVAFAGDAFEELGTGDYRVRTADREQVAALVRAVGGRAPPLVGVVHLWGLDTPQLEDDALETGGQFGCAAAVALVQALVDAGPSPSPRLWLATRGGQNAGAAKQSVAPAQAALWGLGRVVANEHPELRTTLLDLAPGVDPLERLYAELWQDESETEVALRGSERWLHRLLPARLGELPANASATASIESDATYLVTGGLSGFGLETARWLAARGARHLALVSRSGLAAESAKHAVQSLTEAGVEVHAFAADVTDLERVAEVIAELGRTAPPLRGVFHSATVYDDATVLHLDEARLGRALAPKAVGAWNLHRATLDLALDFFVLYSSISAVVGNPGQGNYAAANAVLDGLAQARRREGLAALTVSWGPLAEVGQVARGADIEARLARIGLRALAPQRAFEVLDELLGRDVAGVMVAEVDWQRWSSAHAAGKSARLAPLAPEAVTGAETETLRWQQLSALPADERPAALAEVVRPMVARLLGIDDNAVVHDEMRFDDVGMDSMLTIELRRLLQRALGVNLRMNVLFRTPTLGKLLHYLADELASGAGRDEEVRSASAVEPEAPNRVRGEL